MALIHIGGKSYEIVLENRNGWNPEAFRDRYSEVLERYDYIVGDWGYSQLRLKGFFRDNHQKATKESNLSGMPDYINEYCNFGCAYFILEKTQSTVREPGDFDLDADDERPRIEAADLLAAAAGFVDSDLLDVENDEVASAKEESAAPTHERHSRNHTRENRHRSSNRNKSENNGGNDSVNAGEGKNNNEQQGNGKREQQQQRKGGYKGNDNRGKKPFRLAANETAAASAETNRPIKKDTERS